jgi:hypothetical protein
MTNPFIHPDPNHPDCTPPGTVTPSNTGNTGAGVGEGVGVGVGVGVGDATGINSPDNR